MEGPESSGGRLKGEGVGVESSGQLSKPPTTGWRSAPVLPPPGELAPSANNKKYTICWLAHGRNGAATRTWSVSLELYFEAASK